jgi:hypothetical protein
MADLRKALLLGLILMIIPFAWAQASGGTETMKGTVGETTLLSTNDLHIWLQNGSTGSEVCLGPVQFLRDQAFLPGTGDTVEVTGVRVGRRGVLRANTLQMGGKTLTLDHAVAGQGCPDCGGHHCGHHGCGTYHHGCDQGHHGHCCDHE